jgi:hypothetical protein
MADTKITALTSISTTDPANDVLPIVDISDNAITASGTTKKVTTNQLLGAGGTASFATLAVSGLTTLSDNIVMASAKGIDFSATANSSGTMTSELLADYEEGTWVPADASGAGLTITGTACRYTKIGRAVTIQGTIGYPSTANTTSSRISGLPFAFSDIAPLNISYMEVTVVLVAYFMGFSANQLEFYGNASNGITNANLTGNSIRVFGTYYI